MGVLALVSLEVLVLHDGIETGLLLLAQLMTQQVGTYLNCEKLHRDRYYLGLLCNPGPDILYSFSSII